MNYQALRPVSVPSIDAAVDAVGSRTLHGSDGHEWDGIGVRVLRLEPVADLTVLPIVAFDSLSLHLYDSACIQRRLDGRLTRGTSYPGDVCVLPQDAPVAWSWDHAATLLHIHLVPSLVALAADDVSRIDPAHIQVQDRFNIRDPLIQHIGLALLGEIQTGGLAGSLFAESLAHTLSVHLLRTHSSLVATRPAPVSGLTSQQVQQAKDYINDRLTHALSLSELAAAAGLSPTYFARQFKQSTGMAPHQYVVQCRVERAKTLLTEGRMSIADVAACVGFADQSHLTRHMTRMLGISPKTILHHSKNIQKAHKNLQES